MLTRRHACTSLPVSQERKHAHLDVFVRLTRVVCVDERDLRCPHGRVGSLASLSLRKAARINTTT